ncbi:MAG: methylmalonyl-CoA mutase, partial [Proteobacteria bacterium]|nr:methylmalonyl-CoA mutase [Pseudomonadota bacterium]
MTINGPAAVIWAMYLAVAEKQGVPFQRLRGTLQNDILKEFYAQNEFIFPPEQSMRLVVDTIEYATQLLPQWNPVSISGYHIREAGSTAAQELAFTLADGLAYVEACIERGMDVDDFAPRLSFFFNIGMNFFMEIAKLRAARLLWAELMEPFEPKDPRSSMLRTHCQTSGVSLAAKEPYNNVIRTTIEALAAVLGGTQSLHTNAFDEALALPSPASARIARNTQLVIAEETGITNVIDPLGGSYYVESLTHSVAAEARKLIDEVEDLGGMTKAVIAGMPKLRIEESAARKQARIDRGEEVIVGVNKYPPEKDDPVDLLEIDNAAVREGQIKRLKEIRESRDEEACRAALDALTGAADSGDGNLLELSIVATRARATVGEISDALEKVFTRHRAQVRSVTGVYGSAYEGDEGFRKIRDEVEAFAETEGRRPRMLVVKMGQDGHDRGAKVIATAFADIGFEIDLGAMFQTPEEAAREAIENDVHVIGVSSQAAGHMTLVPQLIDALRDGGAGDIVVVCGGVIPPHDYDFLFKKGVAAIYGPGTNIPVAAAEIMGLIQKRKLAAE